MPGRNTRFTGNDIGCWHSTFAATWFATKVEVLDVNMSKVNPATKGKKVTRTSLMTTLNVLAKDWGTYGSKLLVNFVI